MDAPTDPMRVADSLLPKKSALLKSQECAAVHEFTIPVQFSKLFKIVSILAGFSQGPGVTLGVSDRGNVHEFCHMGFDLTGLQIGSL
jgi:hypothetical protein